MHSTMNEDLPIATATDALYWTMDDADDCILIPRFTAFGHVLDLLGYWKFPRAKNRPFDIYFLMDQWLPLRISPIQGINPHVLAQFASSHERLQWVCDMLPLDDKGRWRDPPVEQQKDWSTARWCTEWFLWLQEVILHGVLGLKLKLVETRQECWCIQEHSFNILLDRWGCVSLLSWDDELEDYDAMVPGKRRYSQLQEVNKRLCSSSLLEQCY